jgi:cob(I)alamin adenosyltransferase
MERGYIHLYTGDGKGKTTAALGLALRAVCAGKRVYFAQFVKGGDYSESIAGHFLPNFTIVYFGRDCFIQNEPTEEDVRLAQKGLSVCREVLREGKVDIVVLDEIHIALYYRLFSVAEVLDMLEKRDPRIDVILTGRRAPQELIEKADLVTEMREIKHYYQQGVLAREGIDK